MALQQSQTETFEITDVAYEYTVGPQVYIFTSFRPIDWPEWFNRSRVVYRTESCSFALSVPRLITPSVFVLGIHSLLIMLGFIVFGYYTESTGGYRNEARLSPDDDAIATMPSRPDKTRPSSLLLNPIRSPESKVAESRARMRRYGGDNFGSSAITEQSMFTIAAAWR